MALQTDTEPAPPRFQIASRLGVFRDTATIADPFGTNASFVIHRHGSAAQKAWFKARVDEDPQVRIQFESMLSSDVVVLTPDEEEVVKAQRAKENPLLPVVDRLTLATSQQALRREAIRKMLAAGQIRPSDMASKGEEELLDEALFLLKGWNQMPDADGGQIPYSEEAARALLTCDTPLDGSGMEDLILSVDAWSIEIPGTVASKDELPPRAKVTKEDEEGVHYAVRHMIPGLTLGQAYQLLFIRRSRETALFRDQVIGAAAKNSQPSSALTSSSGDGASATVA